jgi:hypothetical protein
MTIIRQFASHNRQTVRRLDYGVSIVSGNSPSISAALTLGFSQAFNLLNEAV